MFIRIKDTIINADTIKTITNPFKDIIMVLYKDGTTAQYTFNLNSSRDFEFDRITAALCRSNDPVKENTDD